MTRPKILPNTALHSMTDEEAAFLLAILEPRPLRFTHRDTSDLSMLTLRQIEDIENYLYEQADEAEERGDRRALRALNDDGIGVMLSHCGKASWALRKPTQAEIDILFDDIERLVSTCH